MTALEICSGRRSGAALPGVLLALPLVILAAVAGAIGDIRAEAAVIGALLYIVGVVFYWRGQNA